MMERYSGPQRLARGRVAVVFVLLDVFLGVMERLCLQELRIL